MSYVTLYRKFRPRTFAQVKGQDHIVRTLKNQIRNNRIGHAYLFTGTRGTGKTSVAKILAKAVNCLDLKDGEPCGVCENCTAANQGNFIDIVEIDAASNTGVEDIRRVIEEIQYTPARGKYKVYIIDEVHMLSMNAFNAFLKTLEEPPEYVVFILATTEPHKLPATILSRCQRYDFKRISLDTIAENLKDLLAQEGVQAEEKAVRYVARAGDGSMRDALSLMDRCVAFSTDGSITYESVLSVLGTVDTEDYSSLYRALRAYDAAAALKVIEKTVDSGKDLTPFINDFVMYLRNLLILNVGGNSAVEILGLSEENLAVLREDAKDADSEQLMRCIRILAELLNQLRFSAAKQILVEVAMIRLARPQMETGPDAVLERVRKLEQEMELKAAPQPVEARPVMAQPVMAPQPVQQEVPMQEAPTAALPEEEPHPDIIDMNLDPYSYMPPEPEDEFCGMQQPDGGAETVCRRWSEILDNCSDRRIRSCLMKAQVAAEEDGSVAIYVTGEMAFRQLNEQEALESVRKLIMDVTGISATLFVRRADSQPEIPNQQDISSLFANINMNIETEEV